MMNVVSFSGAALIALMMYMALPVQAAPSGHGTPSYQKEIEARRSGDRTRPL